MRKGKSYCPPFSSRIVVSVLSWSYHTRRHAGEVLADALEELAFEHDPIVITIPNGGVAVGAPIAARLEIPLMLLIVRKLQIPYNPEAGFGALTSFGSVLLNEPLVNRLRLTDDQIEDAIAVTEEQIARRKAAYAGLLQEYDLAERDVILVDDGLASGFTMLAAIESVRSFTPASITVAAPTASAGATAKIRPGVKRLVCPREESGFVFAVANAYEKWYDVSDEEVMEILTVLNE